MDRTANLKPYSLRSRNVASGGKGGSQTASRISFLLATEVLQEKVKNEEGKKVEL